MNTYIPSPLGGARGVILHTTYFGSVDWYRQIACAKQDVVFIEAHEHYVKQTERNHCTIATANGIQTLTVPVHVPAHDGSTVMQQVLISNHGNWRHNHWEALKSAYGMSPFFDFYQDDIRPFFEDPVATHHHSSLEHQHLLLHNMAIATKMLELIGINKTLLPTDTYKGISQSNTHCIAEGCVGPYYQTFQRRQGFIPHLSILDLLFNEGPASIIKLIS